MSPNEQSQPWFAIENQHAVLTPEWSEKLDVILNEIRKDKLSLVISTKQLAEKLIKAMDVLTTQGKKTYITFLTRQGVPIYWLLKGYFEAKNLALPDSNVLAVSASHESQGLLASQDGDYIEPEVYFDPNDETKLKELLHVADPQAHTFLIDESSTPMERSFLACFKTVEKLGGNPDNYDSVTLFSEKSEFAPWDPQHIYQEEFDPNFDSNFSSHRYLAPKVRNHHEHTVALPTLNHNQQSQFCADRIGELLYEIGVEAAA